MKSEKRKKIKKLKRINLVMLRYFLLFAILLTVLLEVTFYIVVSSTAEAQARVRISHAGNEVASLFYSPNNDFKISAEMREYRKEGINFYLLSEEGNIILPIGYEVDNDDISDLSVIISELDGVDEGGSVIFAENDSLVYAKRVPYAGQNTYITAYYSMRILKGSMRVMVLYLVIIGVIVLLVAGLISFSASQKLSDGLKNLSMTAVRFSKGDFDVNFANAEYQELADLSDTLNSVRDEVKKSEDFQREILANVSHDLKTPLTMIKAYASMIREISGDNPEKRDKHLQVIIDEADRLTGLVNDVLNVSKVTSNMDEINFKVFNLTEFLYGIINKFEYLQETQGYTFMVDIDANLYTRADEEKIGQVIYNLLGNAVNYTGEDKTVYISLKKDLQEDRIKLKIRDMGKGIAKDELAEIWNRYYRVKENHSRPVKGTGLGLNIVKIILKNHSFDFGADSELGKGSTFWIDFPAVPEEIENV